MDSRESGDTVDILLVEDNRGDARLVEETLEDARLLNELHIVTDGDEALDFVYQREEHAEAPRPNLILLDWYLPGASGEDVLRELNSDADLKTIPVIVLTVSEAIADQARSYELQASAYVTKPVEPDEFVDRIRAIEDFWLSIVRLPPDNDDDDLPTP